MNEDRQPQSAVSWAFEVARKYKTATRFVLIALAECIEAGNSCPSHKDLADMTGYIKGTIQHALGELVKDGKIRRAKNGGEKVQGGRKTCYSLVDYSSKMTTGKSDTPESTVLESAILETVLPKSTVLESTVPPEPATRARAAGEKELLKELKEKELKESEKTVLTNSFKLESTSAHEGDSGLSPEEIRAKKAYEKRWGELSEFEAVILFGMVNERGIGIVLTQIINAPDYDQDNQKIANPAAYMKTNRMGQKSKPARKQSKPQPIDIPESPDVPSATPEPIDPLWQKLVKRVDSQDHRDWAQLLAGSKFLGIADSIASVVVKSSAHLNMCECFINRHGWLDKLATGLFPDGTAFKFVLDNEKGVT